MRHTFGRFLTASALVGLALAFTPQTTSAAPPAFFIATCKMTGPKPVMFHSFGWTAAEAVAGCLDGNAHPIRVTPIFKGKEHDKEK